MSYLEEANTTTAATHASTRAILQFCVSKIHSLQASLVTATDQDEVLEVIAQMQTVQLSMTMLAIARISDDENMINQSKTLLRSVA